jgi:integrase/recombinase XerD
MPVRRCRQDNGRVAVELLDDHGESVQVVSAFLRHLAARDYSPNTQVAYAHDLQPLWRFFTSHNLTWETFQPAQALDLLADLRAFSSPYLVQRLGLSLAQKPAGEPTRRLSPKTINRILAAVSSFYEFTIIAGLYSDTNPLEKIPDARAQRLTQRYRPFLDGIHRQHPIRRRIGVRTVDRLPRPLEADQVRALLDALRGPRDLALMRLMLDGGLRPGEVLSLHLDDIAYGRRRVTVRRRCDHPKGVRPKSRVERVVDLHEAVTLNAVNTYVMTDRPPDAPGPFLFLVGGRGTRRHEPLGYAALAKLFRRACQRAGLQEPWLTPHSLRHTHATRMWEGGMRELTLQKRLGHASVESTRIYTRISDPEVVADYRRALGLGPPEPPLSTSREEPT